MRFRDATQDLVDLLEILQDGEDGVEFRLRWLDDARGVRSVIGLLLAQPSTSAEMIDDTIVLIVMRSFLTNLFFADHVMLPGR